MTLEAHRTSRPAVSRGALPLFVGVSLLGAFACGDEPPDPTGDLERPTGLAVLSRSADRADLLVVDAEAQGLRVQQLTTSTVTVNGVQQTLRNARFVLGPVIHFPLVIPAEGFPTEVALAEGAERAWVIAPAATPRRPHQDADLVGKPNLLGKKDPSAPAQARLYAITLGDSPTGRSSDPGNETLGYVVLDDPDRASVPMDVVWLGTSGAVDTIGVLFDDLDGTGRFVTYEIDATAGGPHLASLFGSPSEAEVMPPTVVSEIAVGPAPRRAEFVDATARDVLLVSQAGANELTQVFLGSATSTTVSGVGPTTRVVAVDANRALALRADYPAVMVLEANSAGVFEVSSRVFDSPYTPETLRGDAAVPGGIVLPRVAAAGAFGKPLGFSGFPGAAEHGVVMLTLIDGVAVFLRGDTLDLAIDVPAEVALLRPETETRATATVRECDTAQISWCASTETPPPVCAGLVSSPLPSTGTYRAEYRGQLYSTRLSTFTSSSLSVELPIEDVEEFLIQVGDEVEYQCGTDTSSGTVSAVGAASATFQFFRQPNCQTSTVLDVYAAGEEVVLNEWDEGQLVRVHTRAPVLEGFDLDTPLGTKQVAEIATRPDGLPTPVSLTLVSTGPTFVRARVDASARPCTEDASCGPGRTCVDDAASGEVCPLRCSPACEDDPNCNPNEERWVGSAVELRVSPEVIQNVSLGSGDFRSASSVSEVVNAIPHETVWLPLWNQWVTSFPGSRSLLRLEAFEEGFSVTVTL